MAASTPATGEAFTPTKDGVGGTPFCYSWVKGTQAKGTTTAAMRRSPGLLRTPPQRVLRAAPPPPPSTGATFDTAVNTAVNTVGCEYSFVPEKPEPGQQGQEAEARPGWDNTLKDPSIYRLPPEGTCVEARREERGWALVCLW